MSINKLQELFKIGITKEEFITKAKELQQESEESIFTENTPFEEVFDLLNTTKSSDGKEILDANEIRNLANLDNTDGENIISEKDLKVVYNRLAEKINENLDSPEKMFDNSVKKESGFFNVDLDEYISSLSMQISNIDNLIKIRTNNTENIIRSYKDRIDDLINNSKQLNAKFKAEYKKANEELRKAEADYKQNEDKIKSKSTELQNTKDDYSIYKAEKNNDESTEDKETFYSKKISSLNSEYDSLISKQNNYAANIKTAKNNISKLQKTAKSKSKELKAQIEAYENKIQEENENLNIDIENYKNTKAQLISAQEYAISKIGTQNTSTSEYSDADTEAPWTESAEELKQKWSKKGKNFSDGFYKKVVAMAQRLNCDPNAIMGVMNAESGLNPQAVNKNSGATGLIQFMPSTAKSYGTTTSDIHNMSAEQQLNYVEQYLTRSKRAAGFSDNERLSAGQLYALVFLPARAHREVLTDSSEAYYRANRGLDIDGDGRITKGELDSRARRFMA